MDGLTPISHWMLRQPRQRVAIGVDAELATADLVACVAAWMAELSGHSGKRFAVFHRDSFEFLAILLALWQLRCIACIASDNQPGIARQLQAQVDGFIGEFPASVNAIAKARDDSTGPVQWQALDPASVALEICTSGSSGTPKTICKTFGQLETEIIALQTQWPDATSLSVLATVSHQHFYGLVIALLWPFSAGRAFDARICPYPEDIIRRGVTQKQFVLVSSPSHLARLSPGLDWSVLSGRCEAAFSSAAPLRREDSMRASELLQAPVREIYGSTETGAVAWRCQQGSDDEAAWRGLPGARLETTEDSTLAAEAPWLDVNRMILPDRVEFDEHGSFHLLGRVDRIVKIEGKRISLTSLETLLQEHAWVSKVRTLMLERVRVEVAAVLQLTPNGWQQVLQTGRKSLIRELKTLLDGRIEVVAIPRRWRFVERLPYNPQGKLALRDLEAMFDKQSDHWPQILDHQIDDDKLILRCRIQPELEYFNGHMDGQPILPGIAQVHWAEVFGRQWLPVTGDFEGLEVIKFQRIILPDYQIRITLDYNVENGKLDFCYESNRGVHSRGRICFSG